MQSMSDKDLLESVGEAIYGPAWTSLLPGDLKISRSYLYSISKGARVVSGPLRKKLSSYAEDMPAALAERHSAHLSFLSDLKQHLRERWSKPGD